MATKQKKEEKKIPVKIIFTEGYEQRFTKEILKIYERRRRIATEEAIKNEKRCSRTQKAQPS